MTALLALALLAQPPAAGPADLAFTFAVEDSIRADAPEPYRSIFRRMGAPRWREREAATAEAMATLTAHPEDVRWLFAGRRHRDPEVAARCNALIRRLSPCPDCAGSGVSKNWSEWPCDGCAGTGTAWPLTAWD